MARGPNMEPRAVTKPQPGARADRISYPLNPRLERMRFLSRLLDNSIPLPGGWRIGLDPLIGLVPVAGDFVASTLSVWLIYDAARLGLPKRVLGRMTLNVLVEAAFGSIPLLGDIFDAAWKANARNMRLVEMHYTPALRERVPRKLGAAVGLLLLTFYAIILGILYLVGLGIYSLFN